MASDDSSSRPRRFPGLGLFRRKSEDDAPDALEEGEEDGRDIVGQARAFKSLRVADVLTPRADIVAVDLETPFNDLLARFVDAEHSRMPVYRETLDDPVGVVHVKDVFKLVANGGRPDDEDEVLANLKRDVIYVPPSMPCTALLAKMQATRTHMAIVIDEFGGVDGLVTMEDLVEAVVGDIDDEYDETIGPQILARGAGVYEADARIDLEDVDEMIGHDLMNEELDEDIDTLGGVVSALAGRVPQRGEVITHPDGFELEVLEADPRRIRRIRIRDVRPPDTENEDGDEA